MKKKLFILSIFVLLMTALTGCGYVAEFGNEPYLAGDGGAAGLLQTVTLFYRG